MTNFIITSQGTEAALILLSAYPGEVATLDESLTIAGQWLIVEGLHIKDSDFLDRITEIAGGVPPDMPQHNGIHGVASNVVLRDCVIENTRQGIYKNSATVNLIVDGCVIYLNGWIGPDRPHGHGIYCTGAQGAVRNSIIFSNFGFGVKIYDEGLLRPAIDNFIVEDNIVFNNSVIGGQVGTRGDILFGHNDLDFKNPVLRRNYTYQMAVYTTPDINGRSNTNHLGYTQAYTDAILSTNYMPNGLSTRDDLGSTYLENSGNITAPEATNKIAVIPVRGRAHVAVYNWEGLDSVTIDLSTVDGLTAGKNVTIINTADYWVDRVSATISESRTISVDMRAASHTVQAPQGLAAPATTLPTFGCFVVEKV